MPKRHRYEHEKHCPDKQTHRHNCRRIRLLDTQATGEVFLQTQVDLNLHDPVSVGGQRALMRGSVEERKAVRFQLQAPVISRWGNQASLGRTRDISIKGVFVICDTLPPVGTTLSLEVILPPLERNTMQRLHLEAAGKVIRVEAGEESSGFAATAPFALHEMVSKSSISVAPH
jgi:hypothetical protein